MGGQLLRKQHITPLDPVPWINFGGYILEKLGYEYWILPYFGFVAVDGDGFAGLSSYQDDEISVEFDTECISTGTDKTKYRDYFFSIYPNPSHGNLFIRSTSHPILGVHIYSISGQKVYESQK